MSLWTRRLWVIILEVSGREGVMVMNWRCRIGRHNWHRFETPKGEKYAECSRCGNRDWHEDEPPQHEWRGPPSPMPS